MKEINASNNILILSNDMLNTEDINIIRSNTYEKDEKTRLLQEDLHESDDIIAYCINKPTWSEFIIYDLKPRQKRTNITENIQNILNFANDMNCFVVGLVHDGPFPNYINLYNHPIPKNHEHPIIRKMYSPSLKSLNDDDIDFMNNIVKQNMQGLYEKYCYGWFIDTKYETTIKTLCKNKHVKRIILPYINEPYLHETAILDLDAGT